MAELVAGQERMLIPEGKYTAQCISANKGLIGVETTAGTFSRAPKIVLKFQIIDGPHMGSVIPLFINANYTQFPESSKFYQIWVIANNNLKPKRRDKMSLDVFKNHVFTIGIVTVKPNFKDGTPKPEVFWYSKVDEVYERQA